MHYKLMEQSALRTWVFSYELNHRDLGMDDKKLHPRKIVGCSYLPMIQLQRHFSFRCAMVNSLAMCRIKPAIVSPCFIYLYNRSSFMPISLSLQRGSASVGVPGQGPFATITGPHPRRSDGRCWSWDWRTHPDDDQEGLQRVHSADHRSPPQHYPRLWQVGR